ncbi:T9SS type A sorting domain-containing protein, partial [candidate division WOR-3 bacterium]|nr:T9SS type A sorting domain-containing protein [candidate division WOR-3 bacterium]
SVQECAGGGFIIAGYTLSFGAVDPDIYLIRTDVDGDTLWTKTYGGTFGNSVQECAEGGFIVAGSSAGDVYLIRTDADGDTLWTKTYGGANGDYGISVQKCAGGGFIIAGATSSFGAGSQDVYLIRTDSDGDTLWTKTYGGTGFDDGWFVQKCAGGGFIITGYTWSFGAGKADVYLIRTDSDGDTLWTKTYGGTEWDLGNSVQECASGGFIITGSSAGDVYLIRISEAGVEEETGNRHKAIGISLEIYPNPSLGKAVIKLSPINRDFASSTIHQAIKGASIKIYDLSGKLVKQVLTTKQDVEINLEELTNGIYFVRVETHTGLVTNNYKATRKLTIIR